MPDITGLTDYVSAQIAAVIFIIMCVMIVRAFLYLSQRWGMFFSGFIFAVVCYVIVANPGEFESPGKCHLEPGEKRWSKLRSGAYSYRKFFRYPFENFQNWER